LTWYSNIRIMNMRKLPSKPLRFMGATLRTIRKFPKEARSLAGEGLRIVQQGGMPEDWKQMPDVGQGVLELRIHKPHEHRVIYVAKFPEAVYVLNAFEKKSKKTPQTEVDQARRIYAQMLKERNK